MALLGFDDTDSPDGGCTTHVAWRVCLALQDLGYGLLGPPRLVRLNPTVPFKTRGNAGLAVPFGHPKGPSRVVGRGPDGQEILAYQGGSEPEDPVAGFEAARRILDTELRDQGHARAGLVLFGSPPPEALYWAAVRNRLPRSWGHEQAESLALARHAWGSGRGLVGAVAAAAWRGYHDHTFEAIGYRKAARIGLPRDIDPAKVEAVGPRWPSTFDSWDAAHAVGRAVPATPCPVLAGVRGDDLDEAVEGLRSLGPEPRDGWLAFKSNQATDDHYQQFSPDSWSPFASYAARALVATSPETIRGGHVRVGLDLGNGVRVTGWAFEPTKGFRSVVRRLAPGDQVEVFASVTEDRAAWALEKLRVIGAVDGVRVEKPRCGACGGTMRSKGRGAGFRCRACGARRAEHDAARHPVDRSEIEGRYEVPVLARRHLVRPWARRPRAHVVQAAGF